MMLKIGHRGACGYEPENTLLSFKKALDLGVDIIELDVHLSKDKKLIVIHDNTLDRTTNGKGYVSDKTLKELKKLKLEKGEKIPTLKEVLDLINRKVKVNIELKEKGTSKLVFELIKYYINNKNWEYNDFLISSFDYNLLLEFSKLTDKIKMSFLIDNIPKNLFEMIKTLNILSINPSFEIINKSLVDTIHKHNMKVFVWTVNNKKNIDFVKSLKVDGIFSNYPDRI